MDNNLNEEEKKELKRIIREINYWKYFKFFYLILGISLIILSFYSISKDFNIKIDLNILIRIFGPGFGGLLVGIVLFNWRYGSKKNKIIIKLKDKL